MTAKFLIFLLVIASLLLGFEKGGFRKSPNASLLLGFEKGGFRKSPNIVIDTFQKQLY